MNPQTSAKVRGAGKVLLVIVILASVLTSTWYQVDDYITPFISEARSEDLRALAQLIKANGWSDPIIVSYGNPGIWFLFLDRAYVGEVVGRTHVYYGKLQELYYLAPPRNISGYKAVPELELLTAQRNLQDLSERFGGNLSAIRQRPVVLIHPDTYSIPLSEDFADDYISEDGMLLIPPGAVTERDINTWKLFAFSDNVWRNAGYSAQRDWSIAPMVLEYSRPDGKEPFLASYRFESTRALQYTLRIRLWDFPGGLEENTSDYSPLTFVLNGKSIYTHQYGGQEAIWLVIKGLELESGSHTLQVRAEEVHAPIVLSLDLFELTPENWED